MKCTKSRVEKKMNLIKKKGVFIIAEAGVNHNGDLELARKLIESAADAGADAVKFQTFKAEKLVSRFAQKAMYQRLTTDADSSQLEMLKSLEIDELTHRELITHCRSRDIMFLSSPFDLESIDLLHSLGLEIFKIPSGEITNLPYLRKIGNLGKHVILSTGMSDLGEIEDALDVLTSAGTQLEQITVLHCNTEYPTPVKNVNLRCMQTIAQAFQVRVGYSDHTLGIELPIAAVALGASIIEKHLTLDRNLPGPDHKSSLLTQEYKAMVQAIRNIEIALGNGIKKPSSDEEKNKDFIRKSIVAKVPIKKGELYTDKNLTVRRIGKTGLNPMLWDSFLGRAAPKNFDVDEVIS
jgi:N,N'-diacetyllegionaminate synthase